MKQEEYEALSKRCGLYRQADNDIYHLSMLAKKLRSEIESMNILCALRDMCRDHYRTLYFDDMVVALKNSVIERCEKKIAELQKTKESI